MILSEKQKKKIARKPKILELHKKDFMLGQTKKHLSKEKNTIDIGGRNGLYSSFFCEHSKNVYCFEPVPYLFNLLLDLRKSYDNFVPIQKAVSNKAGMFDFYVDTKRFSNSSFINHVNGEKISVESIRLDDTGINDVSFLKVDVEGFELPVLESGQLLIEKETPTCMVEIYYKFNQGPVKNTFLFFTDRDYEMFYNIKSKGLKKITSIQEAVDIASDEKMIDIHDGDFLFVHKSKNIQE